MSDELSGRLMNNSSQPDKSTTTTSKCDHTKLLSQRNTHLPPNLHLSYSTTHPLHITLGTMQYMYDCHSIQYLDCYNNVAHVGHSNKYISERIHKQSALINTNTRYLDHHLINYVTELIEYMPSGLSVVYLVNSGSEANELALRLAQSATNFHATEYITVDSCYYGNTSKLIELSPYKFNGVGGNGKAKHIHVAELPDMYRGRYRDPLTAGELYAANIHELIQSIHKKDKQLCAFISESVLSCGGQLVLPHNYLSLVYQYVRSVGGICIADEVQTGLGRCGKFLATQLYTDCIPDIVTLGKPLGNGYV